MVEIARTLDADVMELINNTVLITGGGHGIGRAMAVALHRRGNRVVIAGRRAAALRAVAEEHPGIEWHPLDLTDIECIRRFVETLAHRWPDVDVLINNAGAMALEDLDAPDIAVPVSLVATNLLGPIALTSLLIPRLRAVPGAAIINVTSALAFVPLAAAPTYSATKAGLHAYTEALRILLRDSDVRVIEIAPPLVATEMSESRGADADVFVADVLTALTTSPDATEVVVEAARALRYADREGRYADALATVNATIEAEDLP